MTLEVLEEGDRLDGELVYIPRGMLTESVVGQIYEAHIKTSGIRDRSKVADTLHRELPKRVNGIKINWIRVQPEFIEIQFEGSPFAWAVFMASLPAILSLIGVSVVLVAIYMVWTRIPGTYIGALIIGLALIYLAPLLSSMANNIVKGFMTGMEG